MWHNLCNRISNFRQANNFPQVSNLFNLANKPYPLVNNLFNPASNLEWLVFSQTLCQDNKDWHKDHKTSKLNHISPIKFNQHYNQDKFNLVKIKACALILGSLE